MTTENSKRKRTVLCLAIQNTKKFTQKLFLIGEKEILPKKVKKKGDVGVLPNHYTQVFLLSSIAYL